MNKQPGIHALHTGLEGLPLGVFNGFKDKGIFGNHKFGSWGKGLAEFAKLMDSEALVADTGQEVAVLEVVLTVLTVSSFLVPLMADFMVNFGGGGLVKEMGGLGIWENSESGILGLTMMIMKTREMMEMGVWRRRGWWRGWLQFFCFFLFWSWTGLEERENGNLVMLIQIITHLLPHTLFI